MQEADKVRKLKTYAQAVLAALDAEPPATDPAIQRVFQDIRSTALETVRRAGAPVKIGVVGEFNAGKTLVLGSLIGFADALPVSEVPTTGNVTALRFVPRPELKKTEVGPFTVEFLDRATALECLRELLKVAEERARDAGLAAAERKSLTTLREQAAAGPWVEVEAWCRQAWSHGGDNPNPAMRNLLRELTWFVRCCHAQAGAALLDAADGKDRVFAIDAETAREGLALARSNTSITALRFEDLPDAPGAMPRPLTAAWLRKAFPLIRRVNADVQLSERIWDLSGMAGAGEWTLLDFPGLGAAESGVRDAFLCRRELREVQTILILLDGRRPGGEGGQNIFSMMTADRPAGQDLRDSILVVMNRFDQLPIQADGGEAVLDRLIAWRDPAEQRPDSLPLADPEPLAEKEVLTQLPVLGAMVVGARNLTRRDDRVVALSALWALADLHRVLPGDVPVGSPDFVAGLTNLVKAPPPLRLKWERLSQLLREAEPRSSLARWLEDLCRDGGLGRLQRLIVDHVAQHGLRQLLDYVRVSAEGLLSGTRRLPKKRPALSGPMGPTADTVRQAVDGLYDTYTALKAEYEQVSPELTVAVDGQRVSLQQMVYDQVTHSVFEWPVWNELLNKVQKDGTIHPAAPAGPKKQRGWDAEDEDPALKLPSDSREFFEPFKQTLQRNESAALDCIRQAVREQLVTLTKRTRPLVESLAALLADPKTRERVEEFDKTEKEQGRRAVGKGQLNVLRWAADPADKDTFDRFLGTYLTDDPDVIAAEACFPLAGADPNQTPQRFPWARSQATPGGNHQVLVLRLRDALADGMRRRVLQRVSQLNKQVLDGFKDTFTTWSERLLMLSGNAALLARVAGEVTAQGGGPEWKTAAVEYPLTPMPEAQG
jgi:Dynamin family